MMARLPAVLCVTLLAAPAAAQTSPYAAEPARAIAALSDEEVAQLLDGAGMGFARAAELNGVPGPRHALDHADSLHLSAAQREQIDAIFTRMQAEARRLGAEIVEHERRLDSLFAAGTARSNDVDRRSVELGRLYGQLRSVHLNAHLETAAVMHPPQVARYVRLRGYSEAGAAAGHEAHH